MYKNRIYRQIAADCTKAYWSSILFYALQLIVSQVAVAYSARMLGVFSADILNNEMQKGLGCLWQILICVAISVTLPLVCSTLGELLMFRASLNHERAVLNRYLNKIYAAAVFALVNAPGSGNCHSDTSSYLRTSRCNNSSD